MKCETSANDWCKACNNFPIPSEYMYEGKLRKVLCSWKYHKWNAGFFINLILESDDLCPLKFGSPTLVSNCKYV